MYNVIWKHIYYKQKLYNILSPQAIYGKIYINLEQLPNKIKHTKLNSFELKWNHTYLINY